MTDARFRPELFSFLRDLADHNDRAWFKANQDRYDSAVKEPALEFIEAFRPLLASVSPHFEANARMPATPVANRTRHWIADHDDTWIATTSLKQSEVTAADFLDRFAELCVAGAPFTRFLCQSLDLDF